MLLTIHLSSRIAGHGILGYYAEYNIEFIQQAGVHLGCMLGCQMLCQGPAAACLMPHHSTASLSWVTLFAKNIQN